MNGTSVKVFATKSVLGHVGRCIGLPPHSSLPYLNGNVARLILYPDMNGEGAYVALSPDQSHTFYIRRPYESFPMEGVDYVAVHYNPHWVQYETSEPSPLDVTWV